VALALRHHAGEGMAHRAIGSANEDFGHRIGELPFPRKNGGFAGVKNIRMRHIKKGLGMRVFEET
jgi:hypothetical protein